MTKDDILQYLNFGRYKMMIIDRRIIPEYHRYVREITVIEENTVTIEFKNYGYDEGGLTFYIEFRNIDELITNMQIYLSCDIGLWENINKTGYYPEPIQTCDISTTDRLVADFIQGLIKLPKNSIGIRIPEGYWKNMLKSIDDVIV